jgi:hypothetical protein
MRHVSKHCSPKSSKTEKRREEKRRERERERELYDDPDRGKKLGAKTPLSKFSYEICSILKEVPGEEEEEEEAAGEDLSSFFFLHFEFFFSFDLCYSYIFCGGLG